MGDQVGYHSATLCCIEDILGWIVLEWWANDIIAKLWGCVGDIYEIIGTFFTGRNSKGVAMTIGKRP
jgi:hypothetical protein